MEIVYHRANLTLPSLYNTFMDQPELELHLELHQSSLKQTFIYKRIR